MELKIYDTQGIVRLVCSPDSSSQWRHEIGVENVVSVNFTTWEYHVIHVGWYIIIADSIFKIKALSKPKHINDSKYTYNLKFYGKEHDTEDLLFCRQNQSIDDLESVFAYDATPAGFLAKVVENMNRISEGFVWKAGDAVVDKRKTINFNGLYVWDALGEIARAFDTEWWVEGEYIHLTKCVRGESYNLGYGLGLKTGLQQNENTNAINWFTRLIPVGSTKNIDKRKYGYETLQLPGREKYIDVNTELGLKEHREVDAFSGIYPHRVGKITDVRTDIRTSEETGDFTIYYVSDDFLPFDPNEYMLPDEVIHMTFNTGNLAGKEFEVNWKQDSREFEIINQYPDDDTQLPGGNLIPDVNDEYVLTNISMPDEYITIAEDEYQNAVNMFISDFSKDVSVYTGNTDYIYIRNNNIPLLVGQRINLVSKHFENGRHESRITSVTRKLNNLDDATINCCSAINQSWKSNVDSSINSIKYTLSHDLATKGDVDKFDYLTAALKEDTSIEGGLIQSALLKLGYTDTDGIFKVMSGTNGIYSKESIGGGVASWWGGGLHDLLDYFYWSEEGWKALEGAVVPSNIPSGLIRHDGTGYFANGNFWWDKNGRIHADPTALLLSFDVETGDETLASTIINIRKDTALFSSMFSKKKDKNGIEYLYTSLPIVTQFGLTMYGDPSTLEIPSIYDGLPIDRDTIYWENGILKAKGGSSVDEGAVKEIIESYDYATKDYVRDYVLQNATGGEFELSKQMVIDALGFTPYSAENPNGYITAASIPSALKNPYALTFGSKTYDGSAAKSITASDLGAALSSDLSKYLPLDGGTVNGIIKLNYTLTKSAGIAFKNNRTAEPSGWAVTVMSIMDESESIMARIGAFGSAKSLSYLYIGHNNYDGNNLRVYTDKVTFGENTIWHAGNFNPADYLPLSGGTLTGNLMLKSTSQSSDTPKLYFQRGTTTDGYYDNYIYNKGGGIVFGYSSNGTDYDLIKIGSTFLQPVTDNVINLGTSSLRWTNGYFDNLYATSNVVIGTTSTSAKLHVNGTALIGNNVAGGELLRFNMDRPWVFIQEDSGANSKLVLKPLQDTKYFIVKNANNEKLLLCYAVNGGNIVEVGGNIRLDNGKGYYAKDTAGNNISLVGFNSSNQLSIGYGLNSKGYIMGLGGKIVNFYYGTERTLGMVLNESGNVGVAITPEYKFHVEQKTDNTWTGVFQTPNSKVYLAQSSGRGIYASVLSGVSTSYLLSLKYNQTSLGSGGSSALYVRTDGNIGIGTESPAYKLAVNGTASVKRLVITDTSSVKQLEFSRVGGNSITTPEGGYFRIITNGKALGDNTADLVVNNGLVTINGNILATGGVTMQSQRSLKNIVDERGLSLAELSAITPTRFTWIDKRDEKIHFGGIADDIEKVLPEVVYNTSEGILTMDYGNAGFAIASSLIKPVIDHETKIRMLETRVKELEEELKRWYNYL